MARGISDENRSSLWLALKELSHDRGVYDPLLKERLTSELCRYWNINPKKLDNKALADQVAEQLRRHIAKLERGPVKMLGSERLRTVVEVCYNIYKLADLTTEDRVSLVLRREWLERTGKASDSSSKRAFNDAVAQIEQQLLASQHQVSAHLSAPTTQLAVPPEPSQPRRWRQRFTPKIKWIVGGVVAAITLAATAWPTLGAPLYHHLFPGSDLEGTVENRHPVSTPSPGAQAAGGSARSYKKITPNPGTKDGWALPSRLSPTVLDISHLPNPSGVKTSATHDPNESNIQRFDNWVYQLGGATVGVTHLRVTLTAGRDRVQVQDICAHINERGPRLTGTLFYKGLEGETVKRTAINLDAAQPCGDYFQSHYLSIAPGRSEIIDVDAVSHQGTVTWTLYADAIIKGKKKPISIDSAVPIRTTASLANATQYGIYYEYELGSGGGVFRPKVLTDVDGQKIMNTLSQQT